MEAEAKALLMELFEAAVASARPEVCLPAHLPPPPPGRLTVLAAGKAAASMARAAVRHYREVHGLDAERLDGLVVTRLGYGLDTAPLPLIEAGHPVPDQASIEASQRSVALGRAARPDDLVLVLLSGGGSALWTAPLEPLDLAGKQAVTRQLLRSGATISELNCVRKHLSSIKGGRLARAVHPAPLLTLAISDVPGDDPSVIASGPTVPDPTRQADALAICRRHHVDLPAEAKAVLADSKNESAKPGEPCFATARYILVATPAMAIDAAAKIARKKGYEIVELGAAVEGEAREVARDQVARALKARKSGRPTLLISGGEVTVTVKGEGRGGPNQEFALALAIALDGAAGIHAIACDTDGTDGGTGAATDPAGAIIGPDTLSRAAALGLDPAAYLADNDSGGFFAALDDLVVPGPTFTNVNDFRAILVSGG
jgi:glycerate 2-kinase